MSQQKKHLLSIEDLSLEQINDLLDTATHYEKELQNSSKLNVLQGKILATLFFEPSTRTRVSFETAMLKCGGDVVTVDGNFSSIQKGETLADMGRVMSDYADIIVMRHPKPHSVAELASCSQVPVINAGDGANQHPTQALLDLYTILKEKKSLTNLSIGFVGDLKYGRTVHSLIKLLSRYPVNFTFISDPKLQIPDSIRGILSKEKYQESDNLEASLPNLDVLYVTRIQEERFDNVADYLSLKDKYFISKDSLKAAKSDMVIMHPLPRVNEIDPAIDSDPRAAYFRQSRNGVFVRMALLAAVL